MISHQSQIVEAAVGSVKLGEQQLGNDYQAIVGHSEKKKAHLI